MRKIWIYSNSVLLKVFFGLYLFVPVGAQEKLIKSTRSIPLGETIVKVNVYEKAGAALTFIAPHYNEQTGLRIAKEIIARNGGRLVEIESVGADGKPSRRVSFKFEGKSYDVDPNRVFTTNGRRCGGIPAEIEPAVKGFAEDFLKIVLAPDGGLRGGERFLAAVHNNGDIEEKSVKAGDLTAFAFVKNEKAAHPSRGVFHEQAEGVYLSNLEADEDNFIFLSTPAYIGYFAEKGFNVVVQKSAAKLQSANCALDDGSFSIFAGRQNISYINLEADARNGGLRQRQMIEAVYGLLSPAADDSKQRVAEIKSQSQIP